MTVPTDPEKARLWRERQSIAQSKAGKGRKKTQAHKDAIARGNRGKAFTQQRKDNIAASKRNKPLSEAHKKAISEGNRRRWNKVSQEDRTTHMAPATQAANSLHGISKIEDTVAQRLDKLGIIYERQKHIGWCYADFFIPEHNLVIEVNGCYFHSCSICNCNEDQREVIHERDAQRKAMIELQGYKVEVIWEHTIRRWK